MEFVYQNLTKWNDLMDIFNGSSLKTAAGITNINQPKQYFNQGGWKLFLEVAVITNK